jgi:hypothetical protein
MKLILTFIQRHPTLLALISFSAGFALSLWRAKPIDTAHALFLQLLTLFLIFILIILELRFKFGGWTPTSFLKKFWRFQELFVHFLLGGLLRGYAIFFLKSSGSTAPLVFLAVLLLLLVCNEIPIIQTKGPLIRTILWTLSLCCYLTFLVPVVLHRLGPEVFTLSLICAFLALLLGHFLIGVRVPSLIRRKFYFWPALATLLLYLSLYHLAVIPPVPLMLTEFKIVHAVEKEKKHWFTITKTPDRSSHTQTFFYAEGDKAMAIFKLVAPPFFEEDLQLRWQIETNNHWEDTDRILIKLQGGRREGFRGSTEKSHMRPGKWRVSLETLDGREISHLKFTVMITTEERKNIREKF